MNYSKFVKGQEKIVSELVWTVFDKYEAPVYSEEGIETFKTFSAPDNLKNMVCNSGFQIFCCFDNEKIIGVLAFRDISHISLLFVHEEYHRRGIAKNLLNNALDELSSNKNIVKVTVNSSPYAIAIYEHMGFLATNDIQEQNGILFIPMVKNLEKTK